MQGTIGNDDQTIDAGRKLPDGIGQQHLVEPRRRRSVEPIRAFDQAGEDRHHGRQLGAIGQPVKGSLAVGQSDEPGAAAEFLLERFPEADLKREQRLVETKRRLQCSQIGERLAPRHLVAETRGRSDAARRPRAFRGPGAARAARAARGRRAPGS